MTGRTESAKDYFYLGTMAYFNPSSLAFYVAGRFTGGALDVWSGAQAKRWEAEGIMLPKASLVGAGAAGIWMDKFMPPEFRALLTKDVQRNVWARIKPVKDDLGRDYMRVRWGDGDGKTRYTEDLDVFIARTGQVPFSFIHFPAPKGSGLSLIHI